MYACYKHEFSVSLVLVVHHEAYIKFARNYKTRLSADNVFNVTKSLFG